MNQELPTMLAATYGSSSVGMNNAVFNQQRGQSPRDLWGALQADANIQPLQQRQPKQEPAVSAARIIKVLIADPNENLPLEKRVLYNGDEKLTDLTDQELFFEVPIAELLAKHNAVRTATLDKAQSAKFGRDIFLEAAKIRDLKMVVVTVATF